MASQTPSMRLVCFGLFLFCCRALAASAVLGLDLGTEYIKAALVKPGIPLEIVLTKDSRRKEAAAVAFKPPQDGPKPGSYPERAYGSDALALAARFPGDVYPNLKALLGLTVDDNAAVQEYAARHPALQLEAHKSRQTVAFKSSGAFAGDESPWLVEELLAMQLKSVRRNAEALAGPDTSVRSVVITVPPFYTMDEKRAVELAANLAGLRVLSLISDGLAVGLNYATSRQFPSVRDGAKPEVHMVFDMGAGSTKATVMRFQSRSVKDVGKFNKTVQEVEVLGSGWDRTLGGDALNALIVDDMISKFVDSSAAKAASVTVDKVQVHGRTIAKLSKEAERIRHVLSANTNTAASFEGLFEDIDFRYKISRADFEKMAEPYAARVAAAVQDAMAMAGLAASDLDSVILHGGATRTPFVQKQLEQVFGSAEKLRNNVNSDEAAVFGAGFRAAELSPSFRVKEIRVAEGAVYGVGVKAVGKSSAVFPLWGPTSHLGAAPEVITVAVGEDAKAEASFVFYQQIPGSDGGQVEAVTKTFHTSNLSATVDLLAEKYACDAHTVQFKLGLQLNSKNGEVEVTKAVAECEAEGPEKESLMDGVKNLFGFGKNKEQQPLKDGEDSEETDASSKSGASTGSSSSASGDTSTSTSTSTSPSSSSTTTTASASTASDSKAEAGKNSNAKKVTVSIPIKYTAEKAGIRQLSESELQAVKDRLRAFEASDRARLQREEIFNRLEAFAYRVRGLLESPEFVAAATEEECASLETMGRETSDWLYGDGADATLAELSEKHAALTRLVDRIEARITNTEKRPALVAGLKESLKTSRDFVESIRSRVQEYEDYHASRSTAASAASSSSSAAADPTAPSSLQEDDFAGLEDDEPSAAAADAAASPGSQAGAEDPLEKKGPLPPMYTFDDLKESDDLIASVSAWLEEMEAAQAKLGPKDDPVLTAKDLEAKRAQLDQARIDLAMKALRSAEGSQRKPKSSAKSKSSKPKKTSKSATTEAASSAGSKPTQKGAEDDTKIKHEEL